MFPYLVCIISILRMSNKSLSKCSRALWVIMTFWFLTTSQKFSKELWINWKSLLSKFCLSFGSYRSRPVYESIECTELISVPYRPDPQPTSKIRIGFPRTLSISLQSSESQNESLNNLLGDAGAVWIFSTSWSRSLEGENFFLQTMFYCWCQNQEAIKSQIQHLFDNCHRVIGVNDMPGRWISIK